MDVNCGMGYSDFRSAVQFKNMYLYINIIDRCIYVIIFSFIYKILQATNVTAEITEFGEQKANKLLIKKHLCMNCKLKKLHS